ncbi:Hypothetical protein ORPV_1076 [Orpheovirus IHUMI-LCC2]|uniref:Uncharacterized protein n=1 Tax=Orpheovirus IHUMI-LCC2 TaxID=2023057 RepID=A0A2I2L656_9VIRU|nr:Hypothetical protein ORPV_1076 [Orpheovirus IHUMI-LCC2]SNW62980.1 Hypothetical protein ORPV_1076 [Orpheovirus IHUMI-LCC2]
MELFTLLNEILFCIFDYVNKLDDINRFICSYKNGYMIRNYIRTIEEYTIENPKVLSLYPNLTKLDGFLLLYNKKLFNVYDMPCFPKIENLCIDFPLYNFYQPIYLYLNKYFQTNNNLQAITFIADDYSHGFGTETSGYCNRFFNINDKVLCIDDDNSINGDIDEINMRKNVINLLVKNNINNSITLDGKNNDMEFIKFILEHKFKIINMSKMMYQIGEFIKDDNFNKSLIYSLSRLEEINIILGEQNLYLKRYVKDLYYGEHIIDCLTKRKIVNKKMINLLIPVSTSKLNECLNIFPNVQEIFILYDNKTKELTCDNDLYKWIEGLSSNLKVIHHFVHDNDRKKSSSEQDVYEYRYFEIVKKYNIKK